MKRNAMSPRDRHHRSECERDSSDKNPPMSRKRMYSPPRRQLSDERHVWYSGSSRSIGRSLIIHKLSSKVSEIIIEDSILNEYEEFGELSVKVCSSDTERYAIINFKYSEDAKQAYMNKNKMPIGNRIYDVEVNDGRIDSGEHYQSNSRQTSRRHQNSQNNRVFFNIPQIISPQQQSVLSALGLNPAAFQLFPGLATGTMDFLDAGKKLFMNNANQMPKNMPPGAMGNSNNMNIPNQNQRYASSNFQANSSRMGGHEIDLKATRTLFVGSLESDIQEHEVLAAFSPFGHVEQIDIKRQVDLHSYSFVRFENVDMAMRAKSQMSGRCVRSIHCKIGFGKPVMSSCLYIGGLGSWVRQDGLQHLLYRHGSVSFFFFEANTTFAIVMYSSDESANEALQKLNGFCLGRQDRRIYLDYLAPDIIDVLMQNKTQISQILSSDSHRSANATFSIREMTFFKTSNWNTSTHSQYNRRQRIDSNRTDYSDSAKNSTGVRTLQTSTNLTDLEHVCGPILGKKLFLMKKSVYPFRCLHIIGNKELSSELLHSSDDIPQEMSHLSVNKRIQMQPDWMAEAADLISKVIDSPEKCKVSVLLALPQATDSIDLAKLTEVTPLKAVEFIRPIPCFIAYLRHKQCACVVNLPLNKEESYAKQLHVFPPSSFSLSILKSAAPKLGCELATMNNYLVLLLCKV